MPPYACPSYGTLVLSSPLSPHFGDVWLLTTSNGRPVVFGPVSVPYRRGNLGCLLWLELKSRELKFECRWS